MARVMSAMELLLMEVAATLDVADGKDAALEAEAAAAGASEGATEGEGEYEPKPDLEGFLTSMMAQRKSTKAVSYLHVKTRVIEEFGEEYYQGVKEWLQQWLVRLHLRRQNLSAEIEAFIAQSDGKPNYLSIKTWITKRFGAKMFESVKDRVKDRLEIIQRLDLTGDSLQQLANSTSSLRQLMVAVKDVVKAPEGDAPEEAESSGEIDFTKTRQVARRLVAVELETRVHKKAGPLAFILSKALMAGLPHTCPAITRAQMLLASLLHVDDGIKANKKFSVIGPVATSGGYYEPENAGDYYTPDDDDGVVPSAEVPSWDEEMDFAPKGIVVRVKHKYKRVGVRRIPVLDGLGESNKCGTLSNHALAGFKHAEPAMDDPSVLMALVVNLDPVLYTEWREGYIRMEYCQTFRYHDNSPVGPDTISSAPAPPAFTVRLSLRQATGSDDSAPALGTDAFIRVFYGDYYAKGGGHKVAELFRDGADTGQLELQVPHCADPRGRYFTTHIIESEDKVVLDSLRIIVPTDCGEVPATTTYAALQGTGIQLTVNCSVSGGAERPPPKPRLLRDLVSRVSHLPCVAALFAPLPGPPSPEVAIKVASGVRMCLSPRVTLPGQIGSLVITNRRLLFLPNHLQGTDPSSVRPRTQIFATALCAVYEVKLYDHKQKIFSLQLRCKNGIKVLFNGVPSYATTAYTKMQMLTNIRVLVDELRWASLEASGYGATVQPTDHAAVQRGRYFLRTPLSFSELEAQLGESGITVFGPPMSSDIRDPMYPAAPIPKLLSALWRALVRHGGLKAEGIFRVAEDKTEVQRVTSVMAGSMHLPVQELADLCPKAYCAGSLIKLYFRRMQVKVLDNIGIDILNQSLETADGMEAVLSTVMQRASDVHLLQWLLDRAVEVTRHSDQNFMSDEALAVVFAPNLFTDIMDASNKGNKWFQRAIDHRRKHFPSDEGTETTPPPVPETSQPQVQQKQSLVAGDYERLTLVGRELYQRLDLNFRYQLSERLPRHLFASTHSLSAGRVLAVTWVHPSSTAVLLRAAPLSQSDEAARMWQNFVDSKPPPLSGGNLVVWKPQKRKKKKTKTDASAPSSKSLRNYDVDSLGDMRDALFKLMDICAPFKKQQAKKKEAHKSFPAKIENSKWMDNVRNLLRSAADIARDLSQEPNPVLVECSDAGDRAAQLTATVQLILDPYYRSIRGFSTLVTKEWCAFAHPFGQRCHAKSSDYSAATEGASTSPVFLMWLHVVREVMRQFPNEFEFRPHLLELLADAAYAQSVFGDFLFNSDLERVSNRVYTSCASIWDFVADNAKLFANPHFVSRISATSGTHIVAMLDVDSSPLLVSFWREWFLRTTTTPRFKHLYSIQV